MTRPDAALRAHAGVACVAVALALPALASAQLRAPAPPSDPLPYVSAFDGYRPYRDVAPGNWAALNAQVGRIGGWRTYAREAQAPDPATTSPAPAPTGQPAAQPEAAPSGAGKPQHQH
ncbi:MAG: hypothetical protein KGJ44_03095 [Betaproteobacteria bacterium]|nr:hypothetical protein [Betaproteobacteria bacterium]MDE2047371.1 hypothetical protein [Betaproteobacteria bacterium]